jgi:hypothetical protein
MTTLNEVEPEKFARIGRAFAEYAATANAAWRERWPNHRGWGPKRCGMMVTRTRRGNSVGFVGLRIYSSIRIFELPFFRFSHLSI